MIPVLDWYAPSLHDDAEGGVAAGSVSDIVSLLKTGVSPRGSALGPMAEVVYSSTQHWSEADLRAVAVFMQSLPRDKVTVSANANANANANAKDEVRVDVGKGRKLYEQQCADCHGAQGEGAMPSVLASGASDTSPGDRWAYPPLAGNRAVTMDSAVNLVRIVRSGGFAPATAGHPRPYGMPPFELSNEDMAAVLSYIRTSWGNHAAPVSASSVLSGK
jgi:mono/diheme cytochrome c family protein